MESLKNITKGLSESDAAWVSDGYKATYANAKSWFNYSDLRAHRVAFICAVNRASKV